MGGKKKGGEGKTIVVAPPASAEDTRGARAFTLHSRGFSYDQIAEELSVTPWVARELTSHGFARLATEEADEVRAVIETRLDDIVRRLYDDLKVATSQTTRSSIYQLLLKADLQRANLLGLNIPAERVGDVPRG